MLRLLIFVTILLSLVTAMPPRSLAVHPVHNSRNTLKGLQTPRSIVPPVLNRKRNARPIMVEASNRQPGMDSDGMIRPEWQLYNENYKSSKSEMYISNCEMVSRRLDELIAVDWMPVDLLTDASLLDCINVNSAGDLNGMVKVYFQNLQCSIEFESIRRFVERAAAKGKLDLVRLAVQGSKDVIENDCKNAFAEAFESSIFRHKYEVAAYLRQECPSINAEKYLSPLEPRRSHDMIKYGVVGTMEADRYINTVEDRWSAHFLRETLQERLDFEKGLAAANMDTVPSEWQNFALSACVSLDPIEYACENGDVWLLDNLLSKRSRKLNALPAKIYGLVMRHKGNIQMADRLNLVKLVEMFGVLPDALFSKTLLVAIRTGHNDVLGRLMASNQQSQLFNTAQIQKALRFAYAERLVEAVRVFKLFGWELPAEAERQLQISAASLSAKATFQWLEIFGSQNKLPKLIYFDAANNPNAEHAVGIVNMLLMRKRPVDSEEALMAIKAAVRNGMSYYPIISALMPTGITAGDLEDIALTALNTSQYSVFENLLRDYRPRGLIPAGLLEKSVKGHGELVVDFVMRHPQTSEETIRQVLEKIPAGGRKDKFMSLISKYLSEQFNESTAFKLNSEVDENARKHLDACFRLPSHNSSDDDDDKC